MISVAPNEFTTVRGKPQHEVIPGLALASQAQLNTLCQKYYGFTNSRYGVSMTMKGIYLNMDIAPSFIEYITIQPGDTIRNVKINNKPFLVTNVSWRYSSFNYALTPDVVMKQIDVGWSGLSMTVIPPPAPVTPTPTPINPTPLPINPFPPFPPIYPVINNIFGWSFVFAPSGTSGTIAYIEIPFACQIKRVSIVGDAVGDIIIDIQTSLFATFPTSTSICGINFPNLNTAQTYQDSVLSGWTTYLLPGNWLTLSFSAASNIHLCTLALYGNRIL
jgi:hypothetical protein